MDSMRSLNKSLPTSQDNRQAPPEHLLQAFRTAALSVTNLYKSAVTGQGDARRTGYQDALEDLLMFLDQENLGVQDGEGWRIRQWATQRYDGGSYTNFSDVEEDAVEPESKTQPESSSSSSSSVPTSTHVTEVISLSSDVKTEPEAEMEEPVLDKDNNQTSIYHFQGHQQAESDMQTDDPTDTPSSSAPAAPIRVEVRNRNSKPTARSQGTRGTARSNPREFTFAAGSKRKLQFPDFFDISNFPDKADGSSGNGSKRGRFV